MTSGPRHQMNPQPVPWPWAQGNKTPSGDSSRGQAVLQHVPTWRPATGEPEVARGPTKLATSTQTLRPRSLRSPRRRRATGKAPYGWQMERESYRVGTGRTERFCPEGAKPFTQGCGFFSRRGQAGRVQAGGQQRRELPT
jgi:hypothetical protein